MQHLLITLSDGIKVFSTTMDDGIMLLDTDGERVVLYKEAAMQLRDFINDLFPPEVK